MPRLFGGYWFGIQNERISENLARLGLRLDHDDALRALRRAVDVVISETGKNDDYAYTGYSIADFDTMADRWPAEHRDIWRAWIESDDVKAYFVRNLEQLRRSNLTDYTWPQPQPRLYSGLRQRIEDLPFEIAEASKWLSTLENSAKLGVSGIELEWSGLAAWLKQQSGPLSRKAVLTHLRDFRYAIQLCHQSSDAYQPLVLFEETCKLIKGQRHPLRQKGRGHAVIRYHNRTHGFKVVMDKRASLFLNNILWVLLDHRGRLVKDGQRLPLVFDDPQSAMQRARSIAAQIPNVKGTTKTLTKWDAYSLPGGERYTEWLLTLPNFPKHYYSSHFPIRNLLAHIRTTERRDTAGRRLLFIEELQSDWNQQGRRYGFQSQDKLGGKVPLNPFHLCWHETAIKAMLILAAQNGFDGLAWANARFHQERFPNASASGLGKFYDDILPKTVRRLCKNWGAPLDETRIKTMSRDYAIRHNGRNWSVVKTSSYMPVSSALETLELAEKLLDQYRREVDETVPVVFLTSSMRVELKDRGLSALGSYGHIHSKRDRIDNFSIYPHVRCSK